jgi:rhodanese-related sulfurtransferase
MVCQIFDLTVAATGMTEKKLDSLPDNKKIPHEKVYLYPSQHAAYYPGAKQMMMKLIFSPKDSKIIGAQIVGEEGVDKRIDVIAMALQKGGTIFDLEEAELCYTPQFGSAKDAVNMAGMIAANVLRGDMPLTHWTEVFAKDSLILDVREPGEYRAGHAEGAVNIPLHMLRSRLQELPHDREIVLYCLVGQRSYYATRILQQNGFTVKNISGGMRTYDILKKARGTK